MTREKFEEMLRMDKEIEGLEEFAKELSEFISNRNSKGEIFDSKYHDAGRLGKMLLDRISLLKAYQDYLLTNGMHE